MSTLYSRYFSALGDYQNSNPIDDRDIDGEFNGMTTALNRKVLCSGVAPSNPVAGQTWVDTTNKYLKVYRNNEWVIITAVHVGSSAMSTPQEGDLWYDSTNNFLKAYNGTGWDTLLMLPSGSAPQDFLYIGTSTTIARKAIGTSGQFLRVSTSTTLEWGSVIDDDTMASATALNISSAESVKAYADTKMSGTASVGNILQAQALTERNNTTTTATKVKEIQIPRGGALRIKFELKGQAGAVEYQGRGQVYQNGTAKGTLQYGSSDSYVEKSEDISGWVAGDLCQLYIWKGPSESNTVYAQNFKIYESQGVDYIVNTD